MNCRSCGRSPFQTARRQTWRRFLLRLTLPWSASWAFRNGLNVLAYYFFLSGKCNLAPPAFYSRRRTGPCICLCALRGERVHLTGIKFNHRLLVGNRRDLVTGRNPHYHALEGFLVQ